MSINRAGAKKKTSGASWRLYTGDLDFVLYCPIYLYIQSLVMVADARYSLVWWFQFHWRHCRAHLWGGLVLFLFIVLGKLLLIHHLYNLSNLRLAQWTKWTEIEIVGARSIWKGRQEQQHQSPVKKMPEGISQAINLSRQGFAEDHHEGKRIAQMFNISSLDA